MKKLTALLALTVVAGCASTTPAGLRLSDLRDPRFLRTEQSIPLTYPKIQMALFKHKEVCGSAPVFAMEPGKTAYATIIDRPSGATNYDHAILFELTRYEGTMLSEARVQAAAYAYYSNAETNQRIKQVFDAIAHPDVCPGAAPEPTSK
ncbi:MAG TPA: hypothetical protein VL001_07555 [Candidimonas sp.]|nr:hypothetical protein [Candidimonas sp.]